MRNILFSGVVIGLCVILFCLIMFVSCSGNGVTQPKQLKMSVAEQQLVQNCNDFSFDLLAQAASSETQENIILSPLSASMLLGMLMNGADGETLAQMQEVVGFDDDTSIDAINSYYRKLLDALPALDSYTKVQIANGIWMHKDYQFYEEYIEACKQAFDAQVKNVPTFLDDKVLNEINRFAADHTNNLIKQIIDPSIVNDFTMMVLANALYFKGIWKDKFKKTDTRDRQFTAITGKEIQTPLMHRTENMTYAEGEDFQMVELPYKGDKYCADIILPVKGKDVRSFVETLDADRWEQILNHRWSIEVELALPKFKLNYSRMLTNDLKAMGMTSALNIGADFSRMTDVPCHVDLIKQNCFMQLDEEGTEAAAVTIGIMKYDAVVISDYRQMIVDRPFVLLVREKDYGTILFTAIIGHPKWQ